MKKPTKAQRHAIYKKAMESLVETKDNSLCRHLFYSSPSWCGMDFPSDAFRFFPEFVEQRPRNAKHYWWSDSASGYAARRRALQRCIDMTAPRKKTEKP